MADESKIDYHKLANDFRELNHLAPTRSQFDRLADFILELGKARDQMLDAGNKEPAEPWDNTG